MTDPGTLDQRTASSCRQNAHRILILLAVTVALVWPSRAAAQGVTFSPASLAFGLQYEKVPSAPQSSTLTNNTGMSVTISGVTPSAGYKVTFTDCVGTLGSGASCTVTVEFLPIKAGSSPGTVTVTGPPTPPVLSLTGTGVKPIRFAYVANTGNRIQQYTVDSATGELRGNGYFGNVSFVNIPCTVPPCPVAVHPSGKFIYAGYNTIGVSGFSVGTSGVLTPLFSPVGSSTASGVAVTPNGKFLYTASSTGTFAYTINQASGLLTQVSGSPFPAGFFPQSVAVDQHSKFVFVANQGETAGTVSAYTISSTTGALTQVAGSPFAADNRPNTITVHPNGKFVYVIAEDPITFMNGVGVFDINTMSGVLSNFRHFPITNSSPQAITIDPTGTFLYLSNSGPATVLAFAIKSNGDLDTPGTAFPTGLFPSGVTVDPSGKFLYNTAQEDAIFVSTINSLTGALTLNSKMAPGISTSPLWLSFVQGTKPLSYVPKFAYVANLTGKSISEYKVNATSGALTSAGTLNDNNGPQAVAVDPFNRFVYTANSSSNISGYTINGSTGALTLVPGSPFTGPMNPVWVTVEPNGQFLYAASQGDNKIYVFSINPANGALTPVPNSPFATGVSPRAIAIDSIGSNLYAINSGDNSLWMYNIAGSFGQLNTFNTCGNGSQPCPTGTAPMGMALHPSGQYIYVANSGDNTITGYRFIDVPLQLKTITGSPIAVGTTPVAVAAEPSGQFLYVANSGDSTVSGFKVDPFTGALTPTAPSTFTTGSVPESLGVEISGKFLYCANKSSGSVSIFAINSDGTLTSKGTASTGAAPVSLATSGIVN